jgi:enamine deaminase RidA (YjgF/YER057c/UK114 family)
MRAMRTFTEVVLERLEARGLTLPVPPPPAGAYQPWRLDRGIGFLAAQVAPRDSGIGRGRVGAELTAAQGEEAARLAALNALARIHEALSGFDRLRGLLRLDGHIASAEGFVDQPRVLDGASRLLVDVLGERGAHARTAFGPARLPLDLSVELVLTFAYDE